MLKRFLAALGLGFVAPGSAQPALSSQPDRPVSFGFKTAWLALQTEETRAVASFLGLRNAVPANWSSSIQAVYRADRQTDGGATFIAPPVDGWTLVVTTLDMAADQQGSIQKLTELLETLSRAFGDAQYFGSYRVVDYVAWFRAENGQLVRGFSWVGSEGEVLANTGPVTKAERDLGYGVVDELAPEQVTDLIFAEEGDTLRFPGEEDPSLIAAGWSIDPQTLEGRDDVAPATGLFGIRPAF